MARINLETSLFESENFLDLVIKIGSKYEATGRLVWAFKLAQKYYLKNENNRLIPKSELPESLEILISFGFITLVDEKKTVDINGDINTNIVGYYVKGSEEQFAWLLQRSNAGKSPRLNTKKRISIIDTPFSPVQSRSAPFSPDEPLTLSLTLSSKKEIIYIPQFAIEDLYKLYPRKLGKKKGLLALTRLIKTQQKYDDVKTAITNYSAFLKKEQVEPRFIKHFPTFINNYTDWLDQEAGSTDVQTVANSFETIDGVIL